MRRFFFFAWIAVFAFPWLLIALVLHGKNFELICQSTYELAKDVGTNEEVRSYGTMTSYYYPNGSGMMRYTGKLRMGGGTKTPVQFSVHRANYFNYQVIGSFVKVTSQKAAKYIDDNADDAMAGEHVYPGFNADSVEYFKMLKMGNGAVAAGIGAMPRIYCKPVAKGVR